MQSDTAFGLPGRYMQRPGWHPVLHLGPRVVPTPYIVRLPRAVNHALHRGGAFRVSGIYAGDNATSSASLYDERGAGTSMGAIGSISAVTRFETVVSIRPAVAPPHQVWASGFWIDSVPTLTGVGLLYTSSPAAPFWSIPYSVRFIGLLASVAGNPNLIEFLVEVLNPVP